MEFSFSYISFVLFLIIRNLLSYYFALATLFYYIFSCLTWALINNIKKKKGNIETKKIEIKNL